MPVSFDFSHQGHALATLHVQFLCSDCILKLVYFDSWSWQSFVSTCDVFNCLSPLNVQNEIQLLSRVFCCSWLVYTSLVKVGNLISDGIVFVFHLAWCVRGLKRLKRFWPYLIVFSTSRMVSLSNYCVRGTRTQPLICVGRSVHYWVTCAINKGGFFEISFSFVVVGDTRLPRFEELA